MAKQFLCILHSSVFCSSRSSYESACKISIHSPYAKCEYQKEAVFPAAQQEESPENVVQQTNGAEPSEITADTMEKEITDVF